LLNDFESLHLILHGQPLTDWSLQKLFISIVVVQLCYSLFLHGDPIALGVFKYSVMLSEAPRSFNFVHVVFRNSRGVSSDGSSGALLFNGLQDVWSFFCAQFVGRLSKVPLHIEIFTDQILR